MYKQLNRTTVALYLNARKDDLGGHVGDAALDMRICGMVILHMHGGGVGLAKPERSCVTWPALWTIWGHEVALCLNGTSSCLGLFERDWHSSETIWSRLRDVLSALGHPEMNTD